MLSYCKKKGMSNTENTGISCNAKTNICSSVLKPDKQKIEANKNSKLPKVKLVYYYDALCGWCYGFSSVIKKVKQVYGAVLNIEVVSGGLFINSKVGFVNKVAPHIKARAYKSVEARTGVKFGESFLKDVFGTGKMVLNSLPPSIALCVIKEACPEKELEFAEMLLQAVYFDGINPIDLNAYTPYVERIGVEKSLFFSKMNDSKYQALAEIEFEKFKSSQFAGMPTLVLQTEDKSILLANGYTDFEIIKQQLDAFFLK